MYKVKVRKRRSMHLASNRSCVGENGWTIDIKGNRFAVIPAQEDSVPVDKATKSSEVDKETILEGVMNIEDALVNLEGELESLTKAVNRKVFVINVPNKGRFCILKALSKALNTYRSEVIIGFPITDYHTNKFSTPETAVDNCVVIRANMYSIHEFAKACSWGISETDIMTAILQLPKDTDLVWYDGVVCTKEVEVFSFAGDSNMYVDMFLRFVVTSWQTLKSVMDIDNKYFQEDVKVADYMFLEVEKFVAWTEGYAISSDELTYAMLKKGYLYGNPALKRFWDSAEEHKYYAISTEILNKWRDAMLACGELQLRHMYRD